MTAIIDKSFADLSAREFHDLARLRVDVFVVEQECPYPEFDGRDTDPDTHHIWLDRDGPVAYLRLLDEGSRRRIGRVVTRADRRGEGLARRLVEHVIATFTDELVLDAQSYLVDWYAGFGFESTGEEFLDDGIPHVPMLRPA